VCQLAPLMGELGFLQCDSDAALPLHVRLNLFSRRCFSSHMTRHVLMPTNRMLQLRMFWACVSVAGVHQHTTVDCLALKVAAKSQQSHSLGRIQKAVGRAVILSFISSKHLTSCEVGS
jgi:hypothetical protein